MTIADRHTDLPGPAPSSGRQGVGGESRGFRADIQALRALAVLLVVVFHYWPTVLPGGYVGVDAFFVLSGFLITSHLLREVDSTGSVSLPRFWARRARRLLPASLVTLAATAVAVMLFVPETLWRSFLSEVRAAALYYVNWQLAADAVDYFAAEGAPSPAQHFWSLSTEEQFYLVWPVLFLGAALLANRRFVGPTNRRLVIAGVVALVSAASLVFSVTATEANSAGAYFISPTRAWEFGAGALLAFVPGSNLRVTSTTRSAIAWAGVIGLVAATIVLDEATPFPGAIAMWPVVSTAAFIAANADDPVRSPMFVGRHRPTQFLGDVSYSWYLWHWPVLVLGPYVLDRALSDTDLLVCVALSLALAAISLRFVEQPFRTGRLGRQRPAVVLGASVAAMTLVVGITAAGINRIATLEAVEASASAAPGDCFGAAALANPADCEINSDAALDPSPLNALEDAVRPTCMVRNEVARVRVCEFGADPDTATATVALIGDSHAGHFRSTLGSLAADNGWRLVTMLKGSCPFSDARRKTNEVNADSCEFWNRGVVEELERRPEISMIFTSGSSLNEFRSNGDETSLEAGSAGYAETWSAVPDTVQQIVAIRDVPRPRPDNIDCLQALDPIDRIAPGVCASEREDAVLPDPIEQAARSITDERVVLVDLNDLICNDGRCLTVVGNSVVYRDGHHLTATFAETLAPYLAERMRLRE